MVVVVTREADKPAVNLIEERAVIENGSRPFELRGRNVTVRSQLHHQANLDPPPEWHQHAASRLGLAVVRGQVVEQAGQRRVDRHADHGSGVHSSATIARRAPLLLINTITYRYTCGAARPFDIT